MLNNNPYLGKALENLKMMETHLLEETRILSDISEKECADNRELETCKAGLEEKDRVIAGLNSALGARAEALEKAARETASLKAGMDRELQALREKLAAKDSDADARRAAAEALRAELAEKAARETASLKAGMDRELQALREKLGSKNSEMDALRNMAETLRAELAEKEARSFSLREETNTQKKLNEGLSREHEAKDAELRALLGKERATFMLEHEKLQKDAAAREKELLAAVTPLKEEVWRKTAEAERARAELAAVMTGHGAEFSSLLEKERAEANSALEKAQEGFLAREKELLDENRALKEAAGAAGLNTGRMRQGLSDAISECAVLRGDLEAATVKLTEQDVLTRSSMSALKELKRDYNNLKTISDDRESELAGLRAETDRLREEKRGTAGLNTKLNRELELKEEMDSLLRESAAREEVLKRKTALLGLELKDQSSVIAYLTQELNAAKLRAGYPPGRPLTEPMPLREIARRQRPQPI